MTLVQAPPRREAFAALRHPDFRVYFVTGLLAMMGDNVEHVITYWLIFQQFHSPALAGFAVISHWAPFLIFGISMGALADRYDCRRLIQIGQVLFVLASFTWAVLFLTGALQMWHAVVLLVVHGFAGAVWSPASQLFFYDVVGHDDLQSAIRLNATSRQLGILFGPAVGGLLLLTLGPGYGLVANCLLYLPLTIWLGTVPHTGHLRRDASGMQQLDRGRQPTPAVDRGTAPTLSLADAVRTAREVAGDPGIVTMVALAGATSFLVGNAFQAQMPEFATELDAGQGEVAYSVLLAANAAGAVVGGFLIEASRSLRAAGTRPAILMGVAWAATMLVFAVTRSYAVAAVALFAAGVLNLAFTAMGQTFVQLKAPPARRGRFVGLFSMASSGMRVGSGFTIGLLGDAIGVHLSLALSAGVLLLACAAMLFTRGANESL